jgi:two-component system, OmpR family, response regulator ChvI
MKKILIVDDETDINLALKVTLEEEGFKVDTFDDTLVALDNFKERFYDLLILDIKMPKMNGFELYKELRKIDDKVKVCFLTAFEVNYTNLKSKYNNLPDPNCVISKPISMDDLVKRVNQII